MNTIEEKTYTVAEYQPFYAELAELEKQNAMLVFDYNDSKGNKEARSHVFALRKTKAALDKTRKAAKDESLKVGRAIDAEAKQIEGRINAMIDVHQNALDAIERAETERVQTIRARIDFIAKIYEGLTAKDYTAHIEKLEAQEIDSSFAEFELDARNAKDLSILHHTRLLSERIESDKNAAELAEFRAKAAAEEEANRAKNEELRIAEKVKYDLAEKLRLEELEQKKRALDKENRFLVHKAALDAFVKCGLTEGNARLCVEAIKSGEIPNVKITY